MFAGLLVLWFSLVGQVNGPEALMGGLAALVASTFVAIVSSEGLARFRPYIRWLNEAWRVPAAVLADHFILAQVLAARIVKGRWRHGSFKVVRFSATGSGGRAAARRVLATVLTTITPNTVVVGIDTPNRTMLVHQMRDAALPDYIKALEAK
jgi:multisubunit Na+/H+ antiporter MnhE subunit